MITICLTYFKGLTLANLDAALHSISRQDLSLVEEIIIIDNDTVDDEIAIMDVVESFGFPVPKRVLSLKHGDPLKTHAWSTNVAVAEAQTKWILFTRADYLLDSDLLGKLALESSGAQFITSNGCHLNDSIEECDRTVWREDGPCIFSGVEFDYTSIDAGVWLATKEAFDSVGGLDERLSAWGHAQTDFQYRLYLAGVSFARIPETLFWHPRHGGPRDIDLAHTQLAETGADLRKMWERYKGVKPYGPPATSIHSDISSVTTEKVQ